MSRAMRAVLERRPSLPTAAAVSALMAMTVAAGTVAAAPLGTYRVQRFEYWLRGYLLGVPIGAFERPMGEMPNVRPRFASWTAVDGAAAAPTALTGSRTGEGSAPAAASVSASASARPR